MSTQSSVRSLYRQLLRASRGFPYNFAEFTARRTRDGFREHLAETDPARITTLLNEAKQSLELVRRQTTISQMYASDRLVVEQGPPGKSALAGATKEGSRH